MIVEDTYVQLGNVRLGVAGAAEMDESRSLLTVPRAGIERVEGVYTVGGERPVVTLVIGLALLVVSLIPVAALFDVLRRGATYYVEWIAAVACIIPAAWLLHLGVRRRWVLVVKTARDQRKLLFPRQVSQVEVESFIAQAKGRFGYE